MLFRVADCSSSRLHVEEDSLENRNIFKVRILPPGSLTFHALSRVFHLEIRRGGPLALRCKSRVTFQVQRREDKHDQEEGRGETAGWMRKDGKQAIILPFSVSSDIALITCHGDEQNIWEIVYVLNKFSR